MATKKKLEKKVEPKLTEKDMLKELFEAYLLMKKKNPNRKVAF